jgi:hypothetical protein
LRQRKQEIKGHRERHQRHFEDRNAIESHAWRDRRTLEREEHEAHAFRRRSGLDLHARGRADRLDPVDAEPGTRRVQVDHAFETRERDRRGELHRDRGAPFLVEHRVASADVAAVVPTRPQARLRREAAAFGGSYDERVRTAGDRVARE